MLPLSVSNMLENSFLIFGGLNPISVLAKKRTEFANKDFVLGSTIFQYVLDPGIWKYYGTMIEPRCYHTSIQHGQYVYITGGYSLLKREYGEMLAVSSTDRLNLMSRQWKRCANMISARAFHAIALHKKDIYVFGGRNSFGDLLRSVEVYNPEQDIWAEISYLPQPTMGLSATCIMDRIWLLGGITAGNVNNPSDCIVSNVYSFSPSRQRWFVEVSLPYGCAFSACVSNTSSLWLIGGGTLSKDSKEKMMVSCSSVLQLPLSAKPSKWKPVATLSRPRHALTAVLNDNNIYVLGGMESDCKCASNAVEVINVNTHESMECTSIPASVCGCSSVLILQKGLTHLQYAKCGQSSRQSSFDETSDSHIEDCLCNFRDSLTKYANKFHVSSMQAKVSFDTMKYTPYIPDKSDSETLSSDQTSYDDKTVEIENHISYENTKDVIGTQLEKTIDDKYKSACFEKFIHKRDKYQNIRYRNSMEIFLNSVKPKNLYCSFSGREISTATKWQKYFDTLRTSEKKLHTQVLESSEIKKDVASKIDSLYSKRDVKITVDKHKCSPISNGNISPKLEDKCKSSQYSKTTRMQNNSSIECRPFLYVQSNLKSQPSESSHVPLEIAELKQDSLPVISPEMKKISIIEESFPYIIIMGGEYHHHSGDGHCVLLYLCSKDLWKYVGYMPEHRCHHCVVFFKGSIYIIGGFDSNNSREHENITSKTICYDLCNSEWLYKSNMNIPRAYHSALVFSDEIYVIGGRDKLGNILASVEAYNDIKNEWRLCKPLPEPVLGAAVTCIQDRMLVFGGITVRDENEIISSDTMAAFNLQNDSWSTGPELPIPLAFSGVSSFLNSVWLYGGLTEVEGDILSTKDIFKYEVYCNTWTKVAELSAPRHASIVISIENKVYIIGGHSTQDQKEVTICEQMDILKNEICIIESLPHAVSGKAGTIIEKL